MVTLLENIIIVAERDDTKDNLVSMVRQASVSNLVLQLDPAKLMEEEFLAAFCHRGSVTVLPLKPLPDFNLSIEKSILTLDMSPIVYSGFGLSAKKVKRNSKQYYYRFQVALNSTNFQPNGPLHSRLRSFFKAFTSPVESGTRIPQRITDLGPFFVDWLPDTHRVWTGELPKSGSIAAYLNKCEHVAIRPQCEVFDYTGSPIRLPDFVLWEKVPVKQEETNRCQEVEKPSSYLNTVNIQLGLTILSYLATGISSSNSAAADCQPNDNPCLTNASLSPIYSQALGEIPSESSVYELKQPRIICLTGLFPDYYYSQLEDQIKSMLMNNLHVNELVYMCKCPMKSADPLLLQAFEQSMSSNSGTVFITGGKNISDSQNPSLIKIRF
ncbi:unnamed protein product [Trichobilharzia szidati]|nr:unnamed protein product [Trichobilharzia szidati]CAH8868913.1 unnamed protein product [Trichobilharzia szidati]